LEDPGASSCDVMAATHAYAQEQLPKNYRELVDVKLPKEKKRKEKTSQSQIQLMYWNVA